MQQHKENMSSSHEERNWAELQDDLLVLIAQRIALLEDFLAFGGACRSWRSVAIDDNFMGLEQTPWLMLPAKPPTNSRGIDGDPDWLMLGEIRNNSSTSSSTDDDDDERHFLSLRKGVVIRRAPLPEARGKRCFESLGWLVTVSEEGEMNLLHPFSRLQIPLPHIESFQYYGERNFGSELLFIRKAVLSSNPAESGGDDYALMVIYEGCGWLGFWKPGDDTWNTVETPKGDFQDIACYKGKFYGVDTEGSVFECDVRGPDPTLSRLAATIPFEIIGFKNIRPYIVECAGALLMVLRDGFDWGSMNDYGDAPEPDDDDESYHAYGTREFQVFEVDLSNGKWEKRSSLGDKYALFLGDNASVSVEARRCPGIKADCIYYTDDCWMAYMYFKRGGGKDMGVYNLEDGSVKPLCEGEFLSRICPPIWVKPSLP